MKKILLLLSIIYSFYFKAQDFIWSSNSLQNTNTIPRKSNKITCDEQSNAYVTGEFYQKLSIGTTSLNVNGSGFFLAKYDVKGNVKWIVREETNDLQLPTDICYDNNGHLYIIGEFEGTVHFGSNTFTGNPNAYSTFLAKYDTTGACIWAQAFYTGNSNIGFRSVASDNAGNIILGGGKWGNNPIMLGTILISDTSCALTVKYDPNGNVIWASKGTGNFGKNVCSVAADNTGNFYSFGVFGSTLISSPPAMVIFDTDTLVANNGNANHFIVKYNSSGMPIWAKSFGGLQYGQVFEIKTDALNNLYLLNYSSDSSSYSIRKYDSNGNSVWTKYMHGITLNSISVDQQSNISFCGHSSNVMLAGKLDNNANTLWITSNNYSTNYNEATDIVAAENGNSFVCGSYSSNVKFGQNLFVSHTVFQNNFTVLINDSTYVPEHKNKITGNIYVDANSNCNFDLGENNLSGASVIAQPGNYCAVTDNFGNYTLNVDSANYTISQILSTSSSLNTYQLCPNANSVYTVNAQSNNQTYANYNFADSTLACSLLKINYNFNHNYIVCNALVNRTFVIENMGSIASNNTEVSITISKSFKPISSTPAWTSYNPIDSTALFNIGTLLPNSSYSITILDSVICNNITWQLPYSYTHMVRVTPINECISTDSIFNNYTLVDYFFISVATPIYTINKSIKIYPNPTKDKIILESTEQLGEIIITNVLGATVFLSTDNNQSLDVDLSNLSPGIYYLNALGQHRTIIKE